jgi:hypothetical protein
MQIQTDRWEGFMKYTVETGLVAIIYTTSLIQIRPGIQKLIEGYTVSREIA